MRYAYKFRSLIFPKKNMCILTLVSICFRNSGITWHIVLIQWKNWWLCLAFELCWDFSYVMLNKLGAIQLAEKESSLFSSVFFLCYLNWKGTYLTTKCENGAKNFSSCSLQLMFSFSNPHAYLRCCEWVHFGVFFCYYCCCCCNFSQSIKLFSAIMMMMMLLFAASSI